MPPGCYDAVGNGGFEAGTTDWRIPATECTAGYTSTAHAGKRAMRLGSIPPQPNVYSYSDITQAVYIPYGANEARLGFWAYAISDERGLSGVHMLSPRDPRSLARDAGDVQYVLVMSPSGEMLSSLVWQRRDERQWRAYTFDLRAYAGRVIELRFGVYNDGRGGATAMLIDDVSLTLCMGSVP